MSVALDLLEQTRRYGLEIKAIGDGLRLRAPRKPPDEVLNKVKAHKPELLALLTSRSSDNLQEQAALVEYEAGVPRECAYGASGTFGRRSERQHEWSPEDWKAFFDERAAIAEFDGGMARREAEAAAYDSCLVAWLDRNPAPSQPRQGCAWCRQPQTESAAIIPVGTDPSGRTWLHAKCWQAWHESRKDDARLALGSQGIKLGH